MMQQAQELQARLAKAQQELAEATVEATAGGGGVTVTVTGQQQVKSIKIAPEAINPEDADMLEDLVLAAVNEALAKSQELAADRMRQITGGLNIPGLT
ncbi:MAG: YbaB/EbfC family nucleoid-associated protein [Dehalococcoidia bacterium]|jgi:DNA-binding YbaB/EbfC family protein